MKILRAPKHTFCTERRRLADTLYADATPHTERRRLADTADAAPRWRRWLRLTGVHVADRRRPILTLQALRCSQLWTGKIIRKTSVFSFNKIRENSAK